METYIRRNRLAAEKGPIGRKEDLKEDLLPWKQFQVTQSEKRNEKKVEPEESGFCVRNSYVSQILKVEKRRKLKSNELLGILQTWTTIVEA